MWQEINSLKDILEELPRSGRFFMGSGCAQPQRLARELTELAGHFADVELIHILTWGFSGYVHPRYLNQFRLNAFFIGPSVRPAVVRGDADYTPIYLSDIPRLFARGQMPIDVAFIQVSPPDSHGFCTLGISVDIVKSAAEHAKIVVAEVNPQMPRTLGDSFIPTRKIHYYLHNDQPLVEFPLPEPDETAKSIARHLAKLIPDGATIQTGIGEVPHAVIRFLLDKHDLGVHSEMISDGILDLIEAGVISNRKKTLHNGKTITSFAMGSRRLYDFVDNNPAVEFYPSDYTNDPYVISRNDCMVAINSALEVDLTGQVCADSLGHKFYSGLGGQADFMRGAARARGGKPIIAMPSTARNGTRSRIVAELSRGAGVTVTRGGTYYVVTEYGIAYLHGKSIRQRALELINIAHPDFRGELLNAVKKRRYVYADQRLETAGRLYPEEYEVTQQFKDTPPIHFRPIKPTDERLLQEFFYSHTSETIYHRYFAHVKTMHHEKAQELVNVDYRRDMAIVGVIGDITNERIVAVGRYMSSPWSQYPEVAFVVHEDLQGKGIGTFLLQHLIKIAQRNGLEGFVAYCLPDNLPMLRVFDKLGLPIEQTYEDGVYKLKMRFEEAVEEESGTGKGG
jgi:acyl-CoA hydrolase/RimJ/RimL family protein N-acetyltransferase